MDAGSVEIHIQAAVMSPISDTFLRLVQPLLILVTLVLIIVLNPWDRHLLSALTVRLSSQSLQWNKLTVTPIHSSHTFLA